MKSSLKSIYHKIIPSFVRQKIWIFRERILKKEYMGKRMSLGKLNPNKTFYVIRKAKYNWGALTTWTHLMPYVDFALRKKLIPIFDLKNIETTNMLLDKENIGNINAWELYYKQPQYEYGLNDILQSKKVILAPDEPPEFVWKTTTLNSVLPLDDEDFVFWRKLYDTCPFSNTILSYAEELKKQLFPKDKKILAVSYRREFEWVHYYNLEFTPIGSHLIRGTIEFVISEIRKELNEYNYDYFFFTVDDRETLDIVKKEFGSACIHTNRCLAHRFQDGKPIPKDDIALITQEYGKREKDVYLRAKEYLTDVYLLSQCDSFLSCGSSADLLAYIINNKKYEHFVQINGQADSKTHASDRGKQ